MSSMNRRDRWIRDQLLASAESMRIASSRIAVALENIENGRSYGNDYASAAIYAMRAAMHLEQISGVFRFTLDGEA